MEGQDTFWHLSQSGHDHRHALWSATGILVSSLIFIDLNFENMKKFKFKSRSGLTIIELLIVIAIMGIISATFYINVNNDNRKKLVAAGEELINNLRRVRNMAASQTTYKFAGDSEAVFPPGGYGIVFDGTTEPAKYFLYADKSAGNPGFLQSQGDEKIGTDIILPTPVGSSRGPLELSNGVDGDKSFYFALLSEKKAITDMVADSNKTYILSIKWPGPGAPINGYEAEIRLGEQTNDGLVITNFGVAYSEYTPPSSGTGLPIGCGAKCDYLGDF
ncbi:MAG: hypothetical protein C3F02_03395 [Parcubacteria group bacterium]|nr:MAG: hypothetical protein C3F02_03395 [Parcubacteria group bacterium]